MTVRQISEKAICVDDVSKIFKLYAEPVHRLKESLSFVRKSYHTDFKALDRIDFEVARGETVGIIGVNGSGKSTLLKLITGVLVPSGGKISVNGRISAILELGLGFNSQYSGLDNIYQYGDVMGISRADMKAKEPDILAYADIGEYIRQPIKTYSSGMLARLAFAVAINIDPDILIVDEALAVGDLFFQAKCFNTFREFKRKGVTILLVSHAMDSILKHCDRTLVLNAGKQIAYGKSDEMVNVYKKIQVGQYDEPDEETSVPDAFPISPVSIIDKSMTMKSHMYVNPNLDEYGDESARIVDMGIFDAKGQPNHTLFADEVFEIAMRVKFVREIHNPIFAYTLLDVHGHDVTGTNTMVDDIDTGIYIAGTEVIVRFRQSLPLPGFGYIVNLGVTGFENNEFKVYHRLYNVFAIQIISKRTNVGVFDPHTETIIEPEEIR